MRGRFLPFTLLFFPCFICTKWWYTPPPSGGGWGVGKSPHFVCVKNGNFCFIPYCIYPMFYHNVLRANRSTSYRRFAGGRAVRSRGKFVRVHIWAARTFFGANRPPVCFAFIGCCAFWFPALVIEGLCPSNSLQAFRERLDPKLFSLLTLILSLVCFSVAHNSNGHRAPNPAPQQSS